MVVVEISDIWCNKCNKRIKLPPFNPADCNRPLNCHCGNYLGFVVIVSDSP